MRKRALAWRAAAVGAIVVLVLQVLFWVAGGVRSLDDQFYNDEVATFAAAVAVGRTQQEALLLCEDRRASLSKATVEELEARLGKVGVAWLSSEDIAPEGSVRPDDCNCFVLCQNVVLNTPMIGVVEATFRPTITYSESGARFVYVFAMGRWFRVGEYGRWEQ